MSRRLFTSESVTEGHPDKIADQISDSILDALLAQDPSSRVAVETLITTGQVHVAGEVTTDAYADIPTIVRERILEIGYDSSRKGFDGTSCGVNIVDRRTVARHRPGRRRRLRGARRAQRRPARPAGCGRPGPDVRLRLRRDARADAAADLPSRTVWPQRLSAVRKDGTVPYLRPDGKTQVTIEYIDGKPARLDTVVVSSQHAADIDLDTLLKPDIEPSTSSLRSSRRSSIDTEGYRLLVNPTGRFEIGGPMGDAGLTGRKIIVDTYGGYGPPRRRRVLRQGPVEGRPLRRLRHALGGQERRRGASWPAAARCRSRTRSARPSRSACSSRPSAPRPLDPARIAEAISQTFDLRPAAIIRDLDLKRPIYAQTAAYGHFGRDCPTSPGSAPTSAEQLAKLANG